MATNVTTDHIKYMEQQLKDKQIHLEKAIQRMTRFNEVTLPAKKNNPRNKNKKHIQDREPIDIESKPEVINLRRAIAHYEYAIEAMKEKQFKESIDELTETIAKEAGIPKEFLLADGPLDHYRKRFLNQNTKNGKEKEDN
jgi:hypothetical protein